MIGQQLLKTGGVLALAAALLLGAPLQSHAATSASTSANFAGYTASVDAQPTSDFQAQLVFLVPAISCSGVDTSASIEPLLGTTDHSSQTWSGGVVASCATGAPTYTAVITIANSTEDLGLTITPGDKISVNLSAMNEQNEVILIDETTGDSADRTDCCPADMSTLQAGAAGGPVPTFTKIRMQHVRVNGAPFSTWNPQASNIATGAPPTIAVKCGPLGSGGEGFSLWFRHN